MLTDEVLKEAAAEAERFLLSTIPEDGDPHVFSKRFKRKMEKLIRRVSHPIRYQVLRVAAAAVLAIATLFGAVMAVSPDARAAVVGWIKSTFYDFSEYSNANPNTNNSSDDVQYEYRLSVAPEGYREVQVMEKIDGKTYIYTNDLNENLIFTYSCGKIIDSVFVKTEKYTLHSATVNKLPADIYIAVEEHETSGIIWESPDGDVLMQIAAIAGKEELIEIAETVIKIES